MMDLFDIVKERPLSEDPEAHGSCPFCGAAETKLYGEETTLLGWTGPVNPNHRHQHRSCTSCSRKFIREVKGLNVWYTQGAVVLRGVPSCFENYTYTCAKCGGTVRRKHYDSTGNPPKYLSASIVDNKWVRDHTTRYTCSACGHGGETAVDYWEGPKP